MRPFEETPGKKVAQVVSLTLFLLVLVGASALARYQYKRGKSDRQGAFRLATLVFLVQMAIWLCYEHFVPDLEVLGQFVIAVSTALFMSALSWILYMALEPYVRKLWPQTIISWARLVNGRIRDPLVARDTMFGVMLGLIWVVLYEIRLSLGITRLGTAPQLLSTDYLLGVRSTLGALVVQLPGGIQGTLFFFAVLIGLRYLLRNRWAAAAGFVAIFTALNTLGSHHPGIEVPIEILIYAIAAFALVRFGLVTLMVAVMVANTMLNVPATLDFSRWYAPAAMSLPIGILALAVWSFYTALGAHKLIKGEMLE